jgi:periplasmic divalent cation tolerance protein
LAACANIIPGVESHYWWKEKLEQSAEVLIIFKTTAKLQMALRDCVLANHPYETAEFITQAIDFGSDNYLAWIRQSVGNV